MEQNKSPDIMTWLVENQHDKEKMSQMLEMLRQINPTESDKIKAQVDEIVAKQKAVPPLQTTLENLLLGILIQSGIIDPRIIGDF